MDSLFRKVKRSQNKLFSSAKKVEEHDTVASHAAIFCGAGYILLKIILGHFLVQHFSCLACSVQFSQKSISAIKRSANVGPTFDRCFHMRKKFVNFTWVE